MLSPIYAITDPTLLPSDQLYSGVEAALKGGITTIQLRDKSADINTKIIQAKKLVTLCEHFHAHLIINDDIDVAYQAKAHGIHLGQEDANIQQAREKLGYDTIIGITCHASLDLAKKAVKEGASYVAFGRFFNSVTKPNASTASLKVLEEAKQILNTPIVAIGGITHGNMSPLVRKGANSLAVCHSLFASENITVQAQALMTKYRNIHSNNL